MVKLNQKHDLFCREYIVDYNGTQAAIRSGYSEKTARSQASVLLTNPNILARVRELQHEQVERLAVSADYVVLKLLDTLEKCMQAQPVMKWDYSAQELVETGEYTFDSKGALRALELIGRHLGMFNDKLQLSGEVNINDARSRLLEAAGKAAGKTK